MTFDKLLLVLGFAALMFTGPVTARNQVIFNTTTQKIQHIFPACQSPNFYMVVQRDGDTLALLANHIRVDCNLLEVACHDSVSRIIAQWHLLGCSWSS
ncbi:hypothetical protein WJX73_010408 [Symbiochloris irregularis]|uniref:Uncharacterized protein n=1 Tax=Symbiochloris irregularis TaxID=706552 RepID=A0AAW1NP00_9CHLO